MTVAALLEARVVRAAHSRAQRQFLPSKAGHPSPAEVGNPCLLWVEQLPPGPEELPQGIVIGAV